MDYEFLQLSARLYFIRWNDNPAIGSPSETHFLEEMRRTLDSAPQPVYFVSDLRNGRVSNAVVLRELGKLTAHRNWGGSASFSEDPTTHLMMNVFRKYSHRNLSEPRNQTWKTPQEAINYLDKLAPGITAEVDWDALIHV